MKKVSILAIITLLLLGVEFITTFVDSLGQTSLQGIVSRATEVVEKQVGKKESVGVMVPHTLNMVPENDSIALDSVTNTHLNVQVPFGIKQVMVSGYVPQWMLVASFLFLLVLPLVIWGIINFIKLLISVLKQNIFTRKNARRLRIFVYATNGSMAIVSLYDWLIYHYLSTQTIVPGYVVGSYEFAISWSDMFLMFLFTEIFALGVKLQEEQELTI